MCERKSFFKRQKKEMPLGVQIVSESLPLLIIAVYLLIGFLADGWHPGWLIFFAIPLYYGTVGAVKYKNANIFPYPVLIAFIYLLCGCVWGMWHPHWVMFLTIPFYYGVVKFIKNNDKAKFIHALLPIIVIATYLCIGFFAKAWHPGWIIFFAIPIFEEIWNVVKRHKSKKSENKDTVYKEFDNN